MQTRYIDADYLLREISFYADRPTKAAMKTIKEIALHPADVVERKKGKWHITDAYPHNVYCSECHKTFAQTHWAVWEDGSLPRNFCPNCGAEMEETDAEVR